MSLFDFFKKNNPIDPWVDEFVDQMGAYGIPVKIAEVRRTAARQRELYAQGRTRSGPVVTWTTRSRHISGEAFDFDFVDARDQHDFDAWQIAGEVGRGLGLDWGGDWRVQDLRHFELPPDES